MSQQSSSEKKNFKHTLNLPQTDFPIRAGLAKLEPALLENWQAINLQDKLNQQDQKADKQFILHDGPPYPNGSIHMGHALNKVLKDIVVRVKQKQGYKSPFIPGWDCHGLPIETQVIKVLKKEGNEDKKSDVKWFRDTCKGFASGYVDTQKDEFKRLGINAKWEAPYLTMQPEYEAGVIRSFRKMANEGIVYKGRKPIHWCTSCETALAEAEIEYADHRSPSIYVKFPVKQASEDLKHQLSGHDVNNVSLLVWTTTPWTLPSNVAVAVHPEFDYVVTEVESDKLILAKNLLGKLASVLEVDDLPVLAEIKGKELSGTVSSHPFIDRESPLVEATYVTEEDGTGFVHIAPGHGQDDYIVGQQQNLPMIMPVDDQGKFTDEVQWKGVHVFEANKLIGMHMDENGSLLKLKMIKHSYPHCWRCKSPVIFRATEQWFVAMDKPLISTGKTLRDMAMAAIEDVEWYPAWGKKRIQAMVEGRPDWCISRQRHWGIPIPVFNYENGETEMSDDVIAHVEDVVKKEGTMAWFSKDTDELLPENFSKNPENGKLKKETDILDVWFESGASFANVLNERLDTFPGDLYLEGSDQHRGWFQSSLLIGLASTGKPPFKQVLTHGFLVDEKGRKMSKSLGNGIDPEQIVRDYGVDILRWWAASTEFRNDVSIGKNIFNQARDSFSKVRNTIRFCLSNLYDFNPDTDRVALNDLNEVDQWVHNELIKLNKDVIERYNGYELHRVTQLIHHFCTVTLSNQYLDITKDRLYCSEKKGHERRSTQTALYLIVNQLINLVSPILVFSSEDAYAHFNVSNKKDSIHLTPFSDLFGDSYSGGVPVYDDVLAQKWETLFSIKATVYQTLEAMRKEKKINSFLEAHVTLTGNVPAFDDWASFLIVSSVTVNSETMPPGANPTAGDLQNQAANAQSQSPNNNIQVSATHAQGEKCDRCWKFDTLKDGLCHRCFVAVEACATQEAQTPS